MKKLIILLFLSLFLFGCGAAAKKSEYWQHSSHFKNWDHMKFSMWGYNSPTTEVAQASTSEAWWGIDVPYVPAK